MSFWAKITGSDITNETAAFAARAKKLPADYQAAWDQVSTELWEYSDFTGRNLMPILDGVLGLLEQAAADGQTIQSVLGDDIKGFCTSLASAEGVKSYQDKLRVQLNTTVAKKLGK